MLSTAAGFYARNPFLRYSPLRPLEAFHRSAHPRRLIRKPNQVGGTVAGGWEAWAHLIGEHRWKPWLKPADGLVMVATLDRTYPRICDVLHEHEPADWLDPSTRYVKGRGYYTSGRRLIRSKAGTTIEFVSGEGDKLSVESLCVGWGWIDEPPKQELYTGFMMRLVQQMGPTWMTFTPVGRPVGWLRRKVEGDPDEGTGPEESWEQYRVKLTTEDCTTVDGRVIRSVASIARQVAGCDEREKAQRLYGEWEGVTVNRALSGFSQAAIMPAGELPDEVDAVRLAMDHGEGDGAQYAAIWLVAGPRVYLAAEVAGKAGQTPREKARDILAALARLGITPYHLATQATEPGHASSAVYGDVNSAGLLGAGGQFNDFMERAFAEEMGLSRCPFSIQIPAKGRGSVQAGEVAMSVAFREGRAFVADTCKVFVNAAYNYTGREQDLKHPIDAARYGVGDILLATRAPGAQLIVL